MRVSCGNGQRRNGGAQWPAMLTPAEELGLSGLSLASRVRNSMYKIPDVELGALLQRIRDEALRRHVIYLRDGRPEAINIMACPLTVLPDQLSYIQSVTLTIQNGRHSRSNG